MTISTTRQFFLDKLSKNHEKAFTLYEEIQKNSDANNRYYMDVEHVYNAGFSLKGMRQALTDLMQHALIDFYECDNGFVTYLTKV